MNAIAFDTLKLARSLREKAKLTPEQAEGFADALTEALQGEVATKGDVKELGTELRGTASELRTVFQGTASELRSEIREAELRLQTQIEATRTQIEATKADILKWFIGLIGLQTIVVIGTIVSLLRNARF